MPSDTDTIIDSTRQLMAVEQLPQNLVLLKMENEQIFAVAKATPRDPLKIVAQLKQLIDAYPQAADDAIYTKPVGTVTEITCGDCKVKYEVSKVDNDTICPNCDSKNRTNPRRVKKFAEGLSIRAAESIRSIYGYTRLATTTELIEDGKVRLTGVLVDYAAGNVTSDERIVSPWYRSSTGKMVQTAEDRFLNITVKAEKAKLRRDVILDNTPGVVKALFRDACENKLRDLVSPELIEQKIIPAFAEFGIQSEHLDKLVGRPFTLGWREEDRLLLRKIMSALKSGETTARELLADLEEPEMPTQQTKTNGGAKASDLMNPKQVKPTATAPENDTESAFQSYRVELESKEPAKARDIYNKWFGPESSVAFSPEQDKAGWALAAERMSTPPNDAESAVAADSYMKRIEAATTRESLMAFAQQAKTDPNLIDSHSTQVVNACHEKIATIKNGNGTSSPAAPVNSPAAATPRDKYVSQMNDSHTDTACNNVYNLWFGENSTIEWTVEDNNWAIGVRDQRKAAIADKRPIGQNRTPEEMESLREKINAYKQIGRLKSLMEDLEKDPNYGEIDLRQARLWVEGRIQQLSGALPLNG